MQQTKKVEPYELIYDLTLGVWTPLVPHGTRGKMVMVMVMMMMMMMNMLDCDCEL